MLSEQLLSCILKKINNYSFGTMDTGLHIVYCIQVIYLKTGYSISINVIILPSVHTED